MTREKKWTLAVLAAFAGVSFVGTAYAAEQTSNEQGDAHALADTVVTAQRREKRDLDTPATTTIITAKEIEKAGYRNVFEAIDQQIGSTSTSYGEAGQDFGFAAGRLTLRGYDRGTLVMVNGVPMNLKNYPSTENIPANMVERIEIVKGAASTLYGAEAMGGVVNIILKQPKPEESEFQLSQTVGNYFKKSEATYTGDRIIVDVSREWSKDLPHSNGFGIDKISWVDWWVGKGKKSRVGVIAQLTDELSLNYNYMEGDITRGGVQYKKSGNSLVPTGTKYNYRYNDLRHTASLVYQGKDNGIHAVLGYNYRKVDGYDYIANSKGKSNAVMDGQILDVQKNWQLGKDSVVLGYSYKREAYDATTPDTKRFRDSAVRTSNSLYTSYSKQFTPQFNLTLGLRGEFINDPEEDQRVFMPQFQTNYQFDRNTAWYINIGKAFQMPTVDDSFRYKNFNPTGLKPESGWTYETGVKIRRGNDTWKAAVYHMDMKNKIGWRYDAGTEQHYAVNTGQFRNTGIELEYAKRFNDTWSLTLGGSVSNPEIQNPQGTNNAWVQDAGRLQGLVRLDYQMAKWQGNLNLKYLGDREYIAQKLGAAQDVPDKIQLNMNVIYTAGKDDTVSLGIYNLLNRENYSNRYGNLDLSRNFRLTYTHAF
ncbi:TonB-dependent receptor domain-containing protein [uncultured Selenomonas sp.]|uniref:TonB-dependent receptor plug domain-containing protein n=1 Tax=uncultured Selenomonas sp. TaxID=159275 RepID=UPI0028EBCC7B|nr:TonB-dependent receptor [uncultured Selenomonas sp.]